MLSERERAIRQRLKDDFEHYAAKCLKVRTKSGEIVPFIINRAQRKIHEVIQRQWKQRGFVRLALPKARQLGSSTYVAGRYVWRTTHFMGHKAAILTHEAKATANLFEMVDRYVRNLPPLVRPSVGFDNANELTFPKLESGYLVGTAGSKGFGRSFTFQLFHGSEVAFWPNPQEHFDGVMQAVPGTGSEVVLESTGNGVGGPFWQTCMSAIKSIGDFEVLFLGWFEDEQYRRDPPNDWAAPAAWDEYGQQHALDERQLYWAYMKNAERVAATGEDPDKGPSWRFMQEYPATIMECFQAGGSGAFILNEWIMRARKHLAEPSATLIIGVDPARGGGDKTGVIDRRGRVMGKLICETWDESDLMRIAHRCAALIRKHNPAAMAIDVTGVGAGVYDRLVEFGFGRIVHPVNFGAAALDPTRYVNRRSEMWDTMREWFNTPGVLVSIPDMDELHLDLSAPTWDEGATSFRGEKLALEEKKHIRKRLGISPDLGDAAALTFALPPVMVSREVVGYVERANTSWKPW